MVLSEHLDDSQLADGAIVQVLEGEHKGHRGKLVGWTTSKGVKHKHSSGKVSTAAVQIGDKDVNGKDGWLNFGFAKLKLSAHVDTEAAIGQRGGVKLEDVTIPGAHGHPPVSPQSAFDKGRCGDILEALMALRADASAWVRAKEAGDAKGALADNVGTAVSHAATDPPHPVRDRGKGGP